MTIQCPYCDRDFKAYTTLGGHIGAKHPERLGRIEMGKPLESTEKGKLFNFGELMDELRESSEVNLRKVIGVLKYYHPVRIWLCIKALLFGRRGYGRIVVVDKNRVAREYIVKLKDMIRFKGGRLNLDQNYAVIGGGGLSTFYFYQGSVMPTNMIGSRGEMDTEYMDYLIEKSRLGGLAMGMKDLEFMKMLLMGIGVVLMAVLYFVYTLVEAGV